MLKNENESDTSCTITIETSKLAEDFDHMLFKYNRSKSTLSININFRLLLDVYSRIKFIIFSEVLTIN